MKCPKCGEEMEVRGDDISFNPDVVPKKEYARKIYWCKDEDIWIRIETPLK